MPEVDGAASATAFARAALVGNPSDGYGGAVLALAFPDYLAEVQVCPAPTLTVHPPGELVNAAVRRFSREIEPRALASTVRWRTSIPLGVGLGGSSAIVIAALRALGDLHGVELQPADLADLALAVEKEELGIEAGLQDRVAQAYGGLTFMDFGERNRYEPLDLSLLPPLLVAYRGETSEHSGAVHDSLRVRFERGEPAALTALQELASLAHQARAALLAGDFAEFARCVDGSFDARARMMALNPRHVEMIECARACGASANYTGSGGAIVCACADEGHRAAVARALKALGCSTVAPAVA